MITVTESAVQKVQRLIEQENADGGARNALRVGVRGGGCSGYSYFMETTAETRDSDLQFEYFGLPVYIDPKSHEVLDGTELDFNAGFKDHGFRWKNPNEKSSCGCGLSFDL